MNNSGSQNPTRGFAWVLWLIVAIVVIVIVALSLRSVWWQEEGARVPRGTSIGIPSVPHS